MSRSGPSLLTNLALAIGVAVIVAVVALLLVPGNERGTVAPTTAAADRAVHIVLAPPPPSLVLAAAAPIASAPPAPVATAAPPANPSSIATAEPFEPPPPIAQASASSSAPASQPMQQAAAPVPASRPGREQVAALTPVDTEPVTVPPPLRTIELENHQIHAVPKHDTPHRVAELAPAERATPKHRPNVAAAPEAVDKDDALGVKVSGPAIVTAPLELNVAGKPLRLYGVKVPGGGDMCAPNAEYAARACLDVSRQALAARIGTGGSVTCHILAVGARAALPAVCKDASGTDLAAYLVEHGFALAEANDMMIDYSAAETRAKTAHSGLWSYR